MDIYKRYGPALMRKCTRMLKSVPDAEDIVQGLFVDLYKKGQTNVDLPYLYRASTNRCLNFIRDKKRRSSLLAEQAEYLKPAQGGPMEQRAIGKETLIMLVDILDKKSREILVYRYFDDMTQEEIAELTGYSRKTVGKRLAKIKEKMRLVIDSEAEQGGGVLL